MFIENTANRGGAIYLGPRSQNFFFSGAHALAFEDNFFAYNFATLSGGAISAEGLAGTLKLSTSNFTRNVVEAGGGGAVYVSSGGENS